MDSRIKEALTQLLLAIIKGFKVLLVYIVPSVLVAVLLSSEFRSFIEDTPALAAYVPIINFAVVILASIIKDRLPEDSGVRKVL